MRFQDRIAVVAGAAAGIGAATVERLAEEGAHVVITDVHGTSGELGLPRSRDLRNRRGPARRLTRRRDQRNPPNRSPSRGPRRHAGPAPSARPIAVAASLELAFATPNFLIEEQSTGIYYNQGGELLDYLVDPAIFGSSMKVSHRCHSPV